jgi:alkylhydroperoxidase family enzyme
VTDGAASTDCLCRDEALGYDRSRTRFRDGEGLRLDEAYRLAHLPLVAPGHPDVIPARDGAFYAMGQHDRLYALVLPIDPDMLERSPPFRDLDGELRQSSFSHKIAWDAQERRRDKLHATIGHTMSIGTPWTVAPDERRRLAELGPIKIEVRGLFSGNRNLGRLYLKLYPECRDGVNLFRQIQRLLGRPEHDLYLAGLYNLTDHLDPGEAAALADIVERWWHRPLLRFEADHLWNLSALDDLVLDGAVEEVIPLTGGTEPRLVDGNAIVEPIDVAIHRAQAMVRPSLNEPAPLADYQL